MCEELLFYIGCQERRLSEVTFKGDLNEEKDGALKLSGRNVQGQGDVSYSEPEHTRLAEEGHAGLW